MACKESFIEYLEVADRTSEGILEDRGVTSGHQIMQCLIMGALPGLGSGTNAVSGEIKYMKLETGNNPQMKSLGQPTARKPLSNASSHRVNECRVWDSSQRGELLRNASLQSE